MTLLLLLALLRSPRVMASRFGRRPFVLPVSNRYSSMYGSGSSSGDSSSSENSWYEYLVSDPWRKMAARFGWLRSS